MAAAVGAEPRRRAERRPLIPRGWVRSPAFTGLAGAVAAAAVLTLWPGGQHDEAPSAPAARFVMHPVELVSAQDRVEWNHEHVIAPGHTLKTVVERGDGAAHQLRLRSEGPVDVSIVHDDPTTADPQDGTQRFTLHGVRDPVLHAPRARDLVVIRNDGAHPVHVSVRTPPAAVRITTSATGRCEPPPGAPHVTWRSCG